jgi:hypothetical protein
LSNRSLYDLSFDDLAGSIYFAGHLFATAPEWASRPENDGLGFSQIDLIVRQRLSQKDVAVILNSASAFDFDDLSVRLQAPNFPAVVSKRKHLRSKNVSNKELLEAYPKLEVTIKRATYSWLVGETTDDPLIATLDLTAINRRPTTIQIETFKLVIKLWGIEHVGFARTEEHLWTKQMIDKQGTRHEMGRQLRNINMSAPVLAPKDKVISGGLQFDFDGISGSRREYREGLPTGNTFTLFLIDKNGEEHSSLGALGHENGGADLPQTCK